MDAMYKNIQLNEEVSSESINFENTMEELSEMEEINETNEMSEMDDNKNLSITVKDGLQSDEEQNVVKTLSLQTILSLPIIPICSIVKLKNDFNFFSRYTQSLTISKIVRRK